MTQKPTFRSRTPNRPKAERCFVVTFGPESRALVERSLNRVRKAGAKSRCELRTFPDFSAAHFSPAEARSASQTLVVSRAADIPNRGRLKLKLGARVRYVLVPGNMPLQGIAAKIPRLGVRHPSRIHVVGETPAADVLYRIFAGSADPAGHTRIVDAWLEGGDLVLLSPSFERLHVPLAKLGPFIGRDPNRSARFEIDEDGSFLYWPHADVHLGWDQFHSVADPAAALAAQQHAAGFNQRYGAAIRRLREESGLTQADIDGLTPRHLRRIETGEQRASLAALTSLAAAHGMPLEDYLQRVARYVCV